MKNLRILQDDNAKYNPLPITTDVKINNAAIIPCPKYKFDLAAAAVVCPNCEYYKGLAVLNDAGPEAGIPWQDSYAIRCNYVIERKVTIIVGVD